MACSVPQTPCRAVVRQFDVEPALRRHFTPHGEVNSSLPYAQGNFLDKVENSSLSRGVRGCAAALCGKAQPFLIRSKRRKNKALDCAASGKPEAFRTVPVGLWADPVVTRKFHVPSRRINNLRELSGEQAAKPRLRVQQRRHWPPPPSPRCRLRYARQRRTLLRTVKAENRPLARVGLGRSGRSGPCPTAWRTRSQ